VKLRQLETALLEPLVVDDEAPVVPGENLHPVPPARDEDEEVAGVDILPPASADDGGQAVDALAEVHGRGREEHFDGARKKQHALPECSKQLSQVLRVRPDDEAQNRPT
jgi:hypothetical protein